MNNDMSTKTDVSEISVRVRELVTPPLRATVDRLEPWLATMSGYHLGWYTAAGRPATAEQGKLIRPMLAVLAAEAVGGLSESAVPGAVAVELVHNFSLVHDDIMDGDELRRGRPTLWSIFGVPAAIMVGDAMHALAFGLLSEHHRRRPAQLLSVAMRELVDGQAQDIKFTSRPWLGNDAVTLEEYQAMATAKTGALLAAALAIGADLGGAPPDVVDTFTQVGRHLGLAFQYVDDILGIWGDTPTTGKPTLSDLRERKKTLPVLGAMRTSHGPELAGLLADPKCTEPTLRHAASIIERAGGQLLARQQAVHQVDSAAALLATMPIAPAVHAELTVLFESLAGRIR